MQCDYREQHDPVTDRPMGKRCTHEATHKIVWEDGRYSFGCEDHLEIEPTATVKPRAIVPLAEVP